ncbi:PH domain-containing protein [Sphingomonas sp. MS122]|uniref:PH domain-containing protein n=1 Tax=Sphingomonas sp. MS122 TaxID=3412683 RepID=UPI003C2D24E2
MLLPDIPLQPLERGQLHVMRFAGAITTTFLTAGAAAAGWGLGHALPWLPVWAVPLGVALLGLWSIALAPRRWARWGWAWTGRELHVASGWLTRSHTIVPASRVQHIDVTQGPVERMFGVATLVLHTAGTAGSEVDLPGISRETAEEIRDAIREHLSGDPW